MDRCIANNVKDRFGFVDREVSRDVLKLIKNDPEKAVKKYRKYENEIQWIIERCKHYNGIKNIRPRNAIFYHIINELYPQFNWTPSPHGTVIKHKVDGIQPSLFSYLLKKVPDTVFKNGSSLPNDVFTAIEQVFTFLGIKYINADRASFDAWLKKGLNGERLTIVAPVCPDYAAITIEEPIIDSSENLKARRHRFTFDDLGAGLGVTASYLIQALPLLKDLFVEQLNIDIEFIIAYGNFEGYSVDNLKRVGLTEAEFQSKIRLSIDLFNTEYPKHGHAVAFDDIVNGKQGWQRILAQAHQQFDDMLVKNRHIKASLEETAQARKSLYDRWSGGNANTLENYLNMLLSQAAEYAAMGICIKNSAMKNPLILGADDHKMGKFYTLCESLPVLYLPRIYD